MNNRSGAHEWAIEFEKIPEDIYLFMKILDKKISTINSTMKQDLKFNLGCSKINNCKKWSFYNWLKQKNKLGGQNKIQRLNENRDFIEEIKQTHKFSTIFYLLNFTINLKNSFLF